MKLTLTYGDLNNPVLARAFEKIRLTRFPVKRARQIVELGKTLQDNMEIMKVTLGALREANRNGETNDAKIGIPTKDWLELLAQPFDVEFDPFTEAELDSVGLSVDELETLLPLSKAE